YLSFVDRTADDYAGAADAIKLVNVADRRNTAARDKLNRRNRRKYLFIKFDGRPGHRAIASDVGDECSRHSFIDVAGQQVQNFELRSGLPSVDRHFPVFVIRTEQETIAS